MLFSKSMFVFFCIRFCVEHISTTDQTIWYTYFSVKKLCQILQNIYRHVFMARTKKTPIHAYTSHRMWKSKAFSSQKKKLTEARTISLSDSFDARISIFQMNGTKNDKRKNTNKCSTRI